MIVKTIIMSALVAMAVLAGIAAPASADSDGWTPQRFWQQQQDHLP
jgi:Spy/CpxP family protein refolding chaperone